MTISEGSALPDANLLMIGEAGPGSVALAEKIKGRKVVIFGLPGAYTGTCTSAHVPSFIRTADKFAAKGVDEIICVSVNDPWVMEAWDAATGAVRWRLQFGVVFGGVEGLAFIDTNRSAVGEAHAPAELVAVDRAHGLCAAAEHAGHPIKNNRNCHESMPRMR